MPLATLSQVLQPALANGYAVAGLVVLGWEDARAFVTAGEETGQAIILQAGPGCRAHTPLPVLGKMFRHLAENASIPVVAHLDHAYTFEECQAAADAGFTSLMYDGSSKPLQQNREETARVVELARRFGASVEGEVGFVGYDASAPSGGKQSEATDPDEAALFAQQTGVDALAVSVGNVHLQQDAATQLDEAAIRAIEAKTSVPLVIHGGSGVDAVQRRHLAKTSHICKFNIGTELRMAFGQGLRSVLAGDPDLFDRATILAQVEAQVRTKAVEIVQNFA